MCCSVAVFQFASAASSGADCTEISAGAEAEGERERLSSAFCFYSRSGERAPFHPSSSSSGAVMSVLVGNCSRSTSLPFRTCNGDGGRTPQYLHSTPCDRIKAYPSPNLPRCLPPIHRLQLQQKKNACMTLPCPLPPPCCLSCPCLVSVLNFHPDSRFGLEFSTIALSPCRCLSLACSFVCKPSGSRCAGTTKVFILLLIYPASPFPLSFSL